MLTLFLFQKGQGFFPSLPIAALLPRSWRGDILNPCRGDALAWLVFFRKAKGQREIKSTLALFASHEARRRMAVERSKSAFLRALCAHSAQSGVKGHCPLREPRGLSPSGGKPAIKLLSSERSARIARSPGSRGTAPCASRGTCRATAVKPRPSRMSPYTPARIARSPKGAQPPCRREFGSLPSRRTARK